MAVSRFAQFFLMAAMAFLPLLTIHQFSRAQEATPAASAETGGPARLGGDLPGDPQIQLVRVAEGFTIPVNIAFPPDDSARMFVVEMGGFIRIVEPNGAINPTPFLDLSHTVSQRPGQQGLLGLAFHPDFAENGKFYVHYNHLYANGAITVSEFLVDPNDPNVADSSSERVLLTIDKPFPQHNGGTLRFGSDGYLYISTGDGGWQGDPFDNAQSRFTLLGKILRIDVDGGGDGMSYGIPADNPFAGDGRYDNPYPGQDPSAKVAPPDETKEERRARRRGATRAVSAANRALVPPVRQEIWAYGFRNPWQFSFDPETNDFYVGDVGAATWEEINFQPAGIPAGQNYGWDFLEASHCYPTEIAECPRQQVGVLPIAEYEHGDDGCAVIGLGVYRGEEFPDLDGIYFSGDYCTGEIRGLQRDENGVWQFENLLDTALQLTGAGQDGDNDLYVAGTIGEEGQDSVWKLIAADQIPEGATTVPIGEPRLGDVVVDEDGAIISGGATEQGEPDEGATTDEDTSTGAQATGVAATPAPAGAESAAVEDEVVIELYDMYFDPDRITIPADTDVRIVLENRGEAPHNFDVKSQGIDVDVEPGGSAVAIVNLPKGTYKFICNVPGHKQVGMNGVLIVE